MSNLEDYNTKFEVIKAIPDDQIKMPASVPVGIYIQEAQDLYIWCQADKDELTPKGLDWTVNELIHHFNYAFRDKSSLIGKVELKVKD